jgi:signal transduction histidine kinase
MLKHSGARLWIDLALVAVVAAAVKVPLQIGFGYYALSDWRSIVIDGGTVAISVLGLVGSAVIHVTIRRRVREQERASAKQTLLASSALDALVTEELRVRKDVAEGLHGTVQQNLVLLGIRVDAVTTRLTAIDDVDRSDLEELVDIRRSLDTIRETDVRTLSQLLYPVGLELGAVAALRLLLQRLPGTIASSINISDAVLVLEGNGNTALTPDRRLLLVRIAEEALSNALRHGRASAVSLALDLDDDSIVLTFDDDGFGISPDATLNGIERLRERLEPLEGTIELGSSKTLGGTRLVARLPGASVVRGPVTKPVAQLGHKRRDDSFEAPTVVGSNG